MLGDFITRFFLLILGYTYPAFECYKTVEKNRVDIEELRFWCQYWILVALLTSFERVGDIFISWLPFYGEMKVMFFVYLWYPKTKGTRHVYGTLLRPYIAQHETEIDRKIMEMRARVWDFIIYYWQNFASMGQSTLTQVFEYVLTQSVRFSTPQTNGQRSLERNVNAPTSSSSSPSPPETDSEPLSPPPQTQKRDSRPLNKTLSALRSLEKQTSRGKKWPPPTPGRDAPLTSAVDGHFHGVDEGGVNIPDTIPRSPITEARAKLRRSTSKSQDAA